MTARLEVLCTKFPDPDSQFRLRPCRCGNEEVGYQQICDDERRAWVIRCFDYGTTSEPFPIRHDAQIYWNTNMAVTPRRSISYEQN